MRYLRNPHTNPYYNMAFDEFCLESLPIDEPVSIFGKTVLRSLSDTIRKSIRKSTWSI